MTLDRSRSTLLIATLFASQIAAAQWSGEVRATRDLRQPNPSAASVLANRLSDVVPPPEPSDHHFEASVNGRWKAVQADASFVGRRTAGGAAYRGKARVKELYLLLPAAGTRFSGGRRVVDWDVGFGFRPNDLVQQNIVREQRDTLLPTRPQGRYVLQAERFSTDASASLVWVNPHKLNTREDRQRGVDEAALAGMLFRREGSTDYYGFARVGRRTGLSVGTAVVGVLTDSLSVHGSARALRRYDGWADGVTPDTSLLSSSPWQQTLLKRHTQQALLGASWTGESRQSVLLEWWYDGTTLSDKQWRNWQSRTDGLGEQARALLLGGAGAPPFAVAGNLGWQDQPLAVTNQRRETILLRLAWQPEPWLVALDTLFNPSDSGRIVTTSLQWQGDDIRINAALRWYGGPDYALSAQLPQQRTGLISATWSY